MKRLIALAGRAGSGKNTVATLLNGEEISFAEPLKRFVQEVFAFTDAQVWGPSEERNKPDARYSRQCERCHGFHDGSGKCPACGGTGQTFLTPRHALQSLGTEWGRSCYENVWADLAVRRALVSPAPLVLITDCRFINEARSVRAAGGEVWLVVRPGAGLAGAAGLHPSEAEQESAEFLSLVTRTIDNSSDLESLSRQVSDLHDNH